ncbi:phosphatase PAP2 family protein [Janibacter sp. CX7]|uniref:phosphatase PAP2 family protein n=1 Tax=Janibacter sp. CX7 TaxID=2963431 RepID=UPI0020CC9F60|nr:phosphatase PAP2 family protein [Janibacter sp. CX7]UTT65172.1 phosphatase PAP2 family protein [Janibacter sp. CX7]
MQTVRSWPYTVAVVVSILVGATALVGTHSLGIPLKDPEGFLGPAYVRLPALALLLFGIGLVIAGLRRAGWRELPRGMAEVARHEWSLRRIVYIATGLITFYVCYVGYRNLKSVLPVYRQDVLFDNQLLDVDRVLFGGADPAAVLHTILPPDLAAPVLSFVYLLYLPLVPVSLMAVLVLCRDLSVGAWYATSLSLNWVLGAVSYYILPALGPVYVRPDLFAGLPDSGVGELQTALLRNRLEFLADPRSSDVIQGVAAFASLHVSVTFALALFLQRTASTRSLRIGAWTFFGLTFLATIYFGWHYVLDNIAGMLIGYIAVVVGGWATGQRRRGNQAVVVTGETEGSRSLASA